MQIINGLLRIPPESFETADNGRVAFYGIGVFLSQIGKGFVETLAYGSERIMAALKWQDAGFYAVVLKCGDTEILDIEIEGESLVETQPLLAVKNPYSASEMSV